MLHKRNLISRILAEANDLKRTPMAMANELGISSERMESIMKGDASLEEIYALIDKMGDFYPIDKSELMLIEPDFSNGVKIMRALDSKKSARVFSRVDKTKKLTPYYEYRDTVMSKISPFKPEWIRELRVVNDNDPLNPDVAYNKGHFLHQLTFFIGPVNFYWEVAGEKHCAQMNTGDSNYITPFWPHSFTSRDANQLSLILAITFAGEIRRAQKEMYLLGNKLKHYKLEYREPKQAICQLIQQHMQNENLTLESLQEKINFFDSTISVRNLLEGEQAFTEKHISLFAQLLHIEPSDLQLPPYRKEEEVVVTHGYTQDAYEYPSKQKPRYLIKTLARSSKMPHMKGFDIQVCQDVFEEFDFTSSLHSYVYNYSEHPISLVWEDQGRQYTETIYPGDSIYLLPFVSHSFYSAQREATLFVARVSGAINFSAQKELSYFSDITRTTSETTCWFEGK